MHQGARREDVMANYITKDSRRRILSKAECSTSAAMWSNSLHVGLGRTSLDAQLHGVTRQGNLLSNQPSRSGHSWLLHSAAADNGRNIALPATSLPRYHRRNMKQTAHNNVAKIIGNRGKRINPETRHAQWDRKVHAFLTLCKCK